MFPDLEHRCYARRTPSKVEVRVQQDYCLRAHWDCDRFRAHQAVAPAR